MSFDGEEIEASNAIITMSVVIIGIEHWHQQIFSFWLTCEKHCLRIHFKTSIDSTFQFLALPAQSAIRWTSRHIIWNMTVVIVLSFSLSCARAHTHFIYMYICACAVGRRSASVCLSFLFLSRSLSLDAIAQRKGERKFDDDVYSMASYVCGRRRKRGRERHTYTGERASSKISIDSGEGEKEGTLLVLYFLLILFYFIVFLCVSLSCQLYMSKW